MVDAVVTCEPDFHKMLQTMLFWGLDRTPESVIEYCWFNTLHTWDTDFSSSQFHNNEVLIDLRTVFSTRKLGDSDSDTICRAVRTGRLELLTYLATLTDIARCGVEAAATAAEMGNLLFLQILHDAGHQWDHTTTNEAARGGHLECLQYAHVHDCPVDVSANTFAAEGGHLACVQYLHTVVGTAWHRDVCSAAASKGYYDILTYAREHGCPWDDMVVESAARGNHVECLKYALEQDCPICDDAFLAACYGGCYDCLVLLFDFDPPGGLAMSAAALSGSLECVRFLYETGAERTSTATDNAARCGHHDVLRYLLDNGYPYSEHTIELATNAPVNSLQCVKCLVAGPVLECLERRLLAGEFFTST